MLHRRVQSVGPSTIGQELAMLAAAGRRVDVPAAVGAGAREYRHSKFRTMTGGSKHLKPQVLVSSADRVAALGPAYVQVSGAFVALTRRQRNLTLRQVNDIQ